MSHQLVSKHRSPSIVHGQDREETTASNSEVQGAEESGSTSQVIGLTQKTVTVQTPTRAVQTEDAELPPKEFECLGKSRPNSAKHLKTTKAKKPSSQLVAKCSRKVHASALRSDDHLSTQVEEDGQSTHFSAGLSPKPKRKSSEPKSGLTKDQNYLGRSIDLGSLPVTMFPPLSPTKINLVTVKANTTDADMFRENPSPQDNMVLQRVWCLEMNLMFPDLCEERKNGREGERIEEREKEWKGGRTNGREGERVKGREKERKGGKKNRRERGKENDRDY